MIDARCDARIFVWRANRRNERRDLGARCFNVFNTAEMRMRWKRKWKRRVLVRRNERIDQCTVQHFVLFVRNKENSLTRQRPAESNSCNVFLKRQPGESERVVSETVCVERLVSEKVKHASVK